ncbi:uncharacterized protein LOC134928761 [Pseudophryne corroboree]|uniref:uncharacterized protein LOC134928761 n=1 Tax=Pseudophryne corroboree TaxID=495146 RepID=UPI003081996A
MYPTDGSASLAVTHQQAAPLLSSPSGSLRHCQPPQLSSSPPPLEACVPGPAGVDFPLTAAEGELTSLLLLGAKHRMAPPPWPSLTNRPLLSSPSGSLRHCQPPQLSSSPPPLEACVLGPAGVDFPLTAAEGELTSLLLMGAKHRADMYRSSLTLSWKRADIRTGGDDSCARMSSAGGHEPHQN